MMGSDPPLFLAPDLIVKAGTEPDYRGRLGPILVEPDTAVVWALAPAKLAVAGRSIAVADGAHRDRVISSGDARVTLTGAEKQDAVNLVAAIPLDPIRLRPAVASRGRVERNPIVVTDIWSLLESRLFVASADEDRTEADVISVDGRFRMINPASGSSTVFDNAIELESTSAEALVRKGDAGALVTTAEGDWVGIIVAGRGRNAFVAPLGPVVSRMGLTVIAQDTITKHNASLDRRIATAAVVAAASVSRVNAGTTPSKPRLNLSQIERQAVEHTRRMLMDA